MTLCSNSTLKCVIFEKKTNSLLNMEISRKRSRVTKSEKYYRILTFAENL